MMKLLVNFWAVSILAFAVHGAIVTDFGSDWSPDDLFDASQMVFNHVPVNFLDKQKPQSFLLEYVVASLLSQDEKNLSPDNLISKKVRRFAINPDAFVQKIAIQDFMMNKVKAKLDAPAPKQTILSFARL